MCASAGALPQSHSCPSTYSPLSCRYSIAGVLYAVVGIVGYFGFADAHTNYACAAGLAAADSTCHLDSNFLDLFGSTFSNAK